MIRTIYITLLIVFMFTNNAYSDSLFRITSPEFCSSVSIETLNGHKNYIRNNVATNGTIYRSSLNLNKLYFFFSIIGDRDTFNYLEEHGHLLVKVIIWCGLIYCDTVELGIKTEEWEKNKDAIESELDIRGYFDWRTFGRTSYINHDKLYLYFKDDNDKLATTLSDQSKHTVKIVD